MKIKKLTAYLLMSGMILGTMSSDLYTIKAQAVETIEETEDKTPENETPQVPETPEQPETEPENEEVPEAAPAGEIELSAEQFPDFAARGCQPKCDWGFCTGKRSVISADFESKRKSGFRAGCDRMQQSEKAVCSK